MKPETFKIAQNSTSLAKGRRTAVSQYGGSKFFKLFNFAIFRPIFAAVYLSPKLDESQHEYVDFGLNVTFACIEATKVGFEAFYHSSRFTIAHGGILRVTSSKKMSMRFLLSMLLLNAQKCGNKPRASV